MVLLQLDPLWKAKAIALPLLLEPRRFYYLIGYLIWFDLAGLQLLERLKVPVLRLFEILQ
jgi:hypothetical protein